MMCARSTAATAEDPAEAVAGAAAEAVAEAGTTSAETIGVIAACSEAAARAGTEAGETSAADDMGAIAKGVRAQILSKSRRCGSSSSSARARVDFKFKPHAND